MRRLISNNEQPLDLTRSARSLTMSTTLEFQYVTLQLRDRPAAASLRCRNRAEIIVLMCE